MVTVKNTRYCKEHGEVGATIIASFAIHPNIIDMILTPAEEEV